MERRRVTGHEVNGFNDEIYIWADGPGPGNASHNYVVANGQDAEFVLCSIDFQNGPIKENGVNGVSNEALLAIVRHRLQGFQSGPYACRENALALTKIEEALHWLHHRTQERLRRGVEGTSKE